MLYGGWARVGGSSRVGMSVKWLVSVLGRRSCEAHDRGGDGAALCLERGAASEERVGGCAGGAIEEAGLDGSGCRLLEANGIESMS